MPKPDGAWVTTCVLCGNAEEIASVTEVAIAHHSPVWPAAQLVCQRCCLAVMDGVHREIAAYNNGVSDDAALHFGVGHDPVAGDPSEPGAAVEPAPAIENPEGAGEHGRERKGGRAN